VTGVATTYNIGVQLDDGTFQWTTVNGAPSGFTVTLTAVLTDSAAPATGFGLSNRTGPPAENSRRAALQL
jgi:hypothetical protein